MRCADCPVDPGLICPATAHPRYCELAHRPEYRAILRARAGEPKPEPEPGPAPLSPGFPARGPSGGRVRAGILSPCCYLGGADLWVADLMAGSDPARVRWAGVAVRDEKLLIPEVRARWEAHALVAVGPDAIRALAAAVDVLVAWGVGHSWGFPAADLRPLIAETPLLVVSHGSEGAALVPGEFGPRTRAAAVSPSAVRGLPEPLRADARVILNRIDPARVARTRPVAETRAGWGIPEGMKVVGWLARLATEKRPEVFVHAVGLLPEGWVGVMAGIGYGEARARELADEVAPGRVVVLGARHDVGDVLAAYDVLAMPSVTEACSLAAGEAWRVGCPLIATRVGVLEEYPELARLIPNPPEPAELAAAILADAADPEGTAARVALAREFARERLAPERFTREWTDLICEAAPRPEPPGLMTMAGNLARSVVSHVAGGARVATPEVQAARKASCFSCETYHDHERDRCLKCGCVFMDAKRAMASESCPPIPPRWGPE